MPLAATFQAECFFTLKIRNSRIFENESFDILLYKSLAVLYEVFVHQQQLIHDHNQHADKKVYADHLSLLFDICQKIEQTTIQIQIFYHDRVEAFCRVHTENYSGDTQARLVKTNNQSINSNRYSFISIYFI